MEKFSEHNFKGEKALVRVDFNVPLDKKTFEITDDTRMKATLPTLKKILDDGGMAIVMSHMGRPKNGPEDKFSLKHVYPHLQALLPENKILFAREAIGAEAVEKAKNLQPGEVLLLENLRFYPKEEKGDKAFAEQLSKLGDVYVNDAFGTAHRAHASTAIIAQFFPKGKKMFGLLMEKEVENAEKVMLDPEKPFLAIIGGAKVSDKILIIENLLEKATDIIIGGGMAYTFIKSQGGEIGNSLCEEDRLDTAKQLMDVAAKKGVNIHLPGDSIIAEKFSPDVDVSNSLSNCIPDGWMGLDIGSMACEMFATIIKNSKTILWNGPMGVFEMENFQLGTKSVAEAVAEATENGAFSLVGGGDSVAAINKFGLADKVSFVSTGGGALLEFFEGKQLPGIAAIRDAK